MRFKLGHSDSDGGAGLDEFWVLEAEPIKTKGDGEQTFAAWETPTLNRAPCRQCVEGRARMRTHPGEC